MAWICDKTGQQKCEIKKLSYNGVFMDVSSITVTVESAVPIAFAIGDYIDWDYDGLRYTLDAAAGVEKQARKQTIGNAFVYDNLVFLSPLKAADNAEFLDVIIGNTNEFLTNTEFSFYGTAWDYAKRLEANLCRMYGDGSWKVRIWTGGTCYDETPATGINTGSWENKLVDVSGIKCLGGFQQIYDLWGCAYVFSVNNGVNYVDFYDDFEQYAQAWKESGVDKIFAYGKGNGLYKIRHTQDTDHVLVTRLRPYGSSDNLPANYYLNSPDYHVDGNESSELAISRLMLPASQWTKNGAKQPANAYLEQNTDLYGVREASVCWDGSDPELGEIKPTIYNLTIQDLLDLMASGTTYRPNTAKWPDTSQRIDKIITGAAPTDNGAVAEAGYDFTVVESNGALSAHEFGVMRVNKVVDFSDLVMGTTPSISHLAEFRIVPTSSNTVAVSFDVPDTVVSAISLVTAYLTPYVGNEKVSDATFPCAVSHEEISVTEDGVHYTRRYKIRLLDSAENPIVFSTMLTGQVTFRIYAEIHFISGREPDASIPVIRTEYAVAFNLLRGNKAIDKFFSVTIPQVGFDLAAAVTSGARLCMRSGANQPREFQIVPSSVRYIESSDTWYFRCKRSLDQSISTYFPNSDSVIAAGDEFYFSGIAMPALYVEIAAQKLLTAATAWLALHSKPRMLSSVDVDNKIMAKESIVLKEGMSLPLSDMDLGITPQNQESRIIDNIRIEEGSDSIRTFSITLRDKKEKSSLDQAIRGATSNFATNTSVADAIGAVDNRDHGSLSGRDMPNQHPISSITGLEEALAALTFFEKDGNGNIKLKDEYGGLWANGFVSAGGRSSGGGGGGGIIETLYRIDDFGGTFDPNASDTFNAYAINSLHLRIAALELHPGGVTSVAGLTGDITTAQLATALGISDLNNNLTTISDVMKSLQSQMDSVATRNCFDEIITSSMFADVIAASDIYVENIHLGSKTLSEAGTVVTIAGNALQLGGTLTAAALASSLASSLYWANVQVSTQSNAATAPTFASVTAAKVYLNATTYFELDSNGYVHLVHPSGKGFYADGFVSAGGVSSGSGGGGGGEGGLTPDGMWDLLAASTNEQINASHLADALQTYATQAWVASQGYAVAAIVEATYQPIISDLATIRNNASNGNTAFGWGNHATAGYLTSANGDVISLALQSLQSQIDALATVDMFDELKASSLFVDTIAASGLYADVICLGAGTPTLTWDATNGAWHLSGNFYADGWVSAGGVSSTAGGGGGGINEDALWELLGNTDSTKQINVAHLTGALATYATQAWVTEQGYLNAVAAAATYQPIISDLSTIRSNATHGETAYGWGNHAVAGYLTSANGTTISEAIQSLQAQIDAVAARNNFDEIIASCVFADVLAASGIYADTIDLAGSDLSATLGTISGKITTLEGYFDASGNAKSALKLTTVNKTAWGQTYWTSGGVPDSISGNMSNVGNISMNGSISGATTITASGLIKTTNYMQATRLYLTDNIYFVVDANGVKLEGAGFYTDYFVSAGGLSDSGGSGAGINAAAMWAYLKNESPDTTYNNEKIATAHIPDMASIYNYVKTSDISDMATKNWVRSQNYVSSTDLTIVDTVIRSLQSQVDSVASRSEFDEIVTSAIFADAASIFDLYTVNVHLGDKSLTETSAVVSINGATLALGGSMNTASITGGTAGTSSATSGTSISIPYVTMNQYGVVTGYGTHTHTISVANIVSTLGTTAVNRATADASGNTITTTYATISRLDSDELTLAAALESLQSQIDAVASRNDFDEIIATVVDSDTISAQNGYFVAISGSLSGNATTASYLVGSSYGVGSASLPVYFSGGLPVACTASSLFSGLSSSAGTNLSITIAGQNRTATLYATYDSASENIASAFGTVSTLIQSLQAQIDSVAAARAFDELTIGSLYADTFSVGADAHVAKLLYIGGESAYLNYVSNYSGIHANVGFYSDSYVSAGGLSSSSDARLKDNISTVTRDRAKSVIMSLRPCEWVWNEKNACFAGKHGAGLIAQEVAAILPDCVMNNHDYLSLLYTQLHAYEIGLLQSHEDRITALENKVKHLEMENNQLKQRLNAN